MKETSHDPLANTPSGRANALLKVMTERGYVPEGFIDTFTHTMEVEWDPANGARVVARAWTDPEYRELLLRDGTAACQQFGYTGMQGEYIVALENTPTLQNVIVCSLCSCTAWPVLGLPPVWYKAAPYRARAVIDPRGVLREFGIEMPDDVEVRVWDSTSEVRYMVLPERPAGTEGWSEERLAALVTRDAMIGTAKVTVPAPVAAR